MEILEGSEIKMRVVKYGNSDYLCFNEEIKSFLNMNETVELILKFEKGKGGRFITIRLPE